jgi:hypothetical protein
MTHHVSTILPIVMQCLNPRGKVEAIYAYAPAPFTSEKIRVRVLDVRIVDLVNPHKVADVCALDPHCLPFSVLPEQLTSISVFTTWTMEDE